MRPQLRVQRRVAIGAAILCAVACGGSSKSSYGDSGSAAGNVASGPSSSMSLVRGSIVSITGSTMTVQGDSGTVQVALEQPIKVYTRQPATLSRVTPNTFVGVTSVQQPDGSDRATEIHIFPEELRGLGEGSRPMGQGTSGAHGSMMTNGSTMSNGTAMTNGNTMTNGSTMSNGSVQSAAGKSIVVQYAGGSKTIVVPPNTPVAELVAASQPLAVGDRVVVVATRDASGSLTSNRVMLSGK